MKENIVELNDISKTFDKKKIINELTFSIKEGEVFGLLGPNGAGKTTILRMLVGLARPTSGEIKVCGFNVHKNHKKALSNIGAIIENPEMYTYMTGYENLKYYSRMGFNLVEEDILEVAKALDLEGFLSKKVKNYSLGMKQRLGIAQAILHRPKVLILDEPTNGLDPAGIRELRKKLKVMAHEKNMSIIVSSHLLGEVEKMCDRVAIIKEGNLLKIKDLTEEKSLTNSFHILKLKPFEKAKYYLESKEYDFVEDCKKSSFKINDNDIRESISDVIKDLVFNDIEVHGVRTEKNALEEEFINLTEKGEIRDVEVSSE